MQILLVLITPLLEAARTLFVDDGGKNPQSANIVPLCNTSGAPGPICTCGPYPGPGEGLCWSCSACGGCRDCKDCTACRQNPPPVVPNCSAVSGSNSVCACGPIAANGPGEGYCYTCPGICSLSHASCSVCRQDTLPPPHPPSMPACQSLKRSSICECGPGHRYPGPGIGRCWSCPDCPAPTEGQNCSTCWFNGVPPTPLPPPPPPPPPAPPAPPGPLCNINGTWNMTVGVGPVLNGGLHLADMHISQAAGSRDFTLAWRDGHVAGSHAHAQGTMIGNHSMKTANNTPHFNWGIDFEGTVTRSAYGNWSNRAQTAPDCTWITFCTSCCPTPGPDCCCVRNGTVENDAAHGGRDAARAGHPPDTPQPRVVHWCKHPFCPYRLPPPIDTHAFS